MFKFPGMSDELNEAIKRSLPQNYEFQVAEIVDKAKKQNAKHVGLQFPDGLLLFASSIAEIIRKFADGPEVTILGDVVYGACCIDDLTARSLGVDFLVHFAHSCLVPVDQTTVRTMYVLVRIKFDTEHLVQSILHNFKNDVPIALQGTVQFSNALAEVGERLALSGYDAVVPQIRPLGPGETLGCTAPLLRSDRTIIFVADGRFHLEAAMMANPKLCAFRYDPYTGRLFKESFDHVEMKRVRTLAISRAQKAKTVGLILGTLGRQGSVGILESVRAILTKRGIKTFTLLMSEIDESKLSQFGSKVDAWVQVACPRLSIDWGESFSKPLLSSFEAFTAWDEGAEQFDDIPMDYYSNEGGPWANYTTDGGYGGSQKTKFWHMGAGRKLLKYD